MTTREFTFLDPGELTDGELELVLREAAPAEPSKGLVPAYLFDMVLTGTRRRVGRISLRVGDTERILLYSGHVGYGVDAAYRGHRFAARATRLLLPLARGHGMKELWITVTPDNAASRRTCEILGAEMVEIVDVPPGCEPYAGGDRQKCRYRVDL
jgi:tagatose 1,6-diphosphate aldolase